jgi:hypothetical protein
MRAKSASRRAAVSALLSAKPKPAMDASSAAGQ